MTALKNKRVRIWTSNYDEQVQPNLTYPHDSIPDLLDRQVDRDPQKTAIIFETQKLSYLQIRQQALSFSSHLQKMGFSRGDHLGICLENTPEMVISYFGCLYAGGVVCALNPSFPLIELKKQILLAGIEYLVGNDMLTNDIQSDSTDGTHIKVIAISGQPGNKPLILNRSVPFREMVKDLAMYEKPVTVDPESPAVLQFSGGTTGKPKAAIGSHRNIVANVHQFKSWLHVLKEGQETFLVSIPLYHVYGMVLGLNLGIALGATLVLTRNARNIEQVISSLRQYPISYFPGVPSLFHLINRNPSVMSGEIDLRKIKACISGSAPLAETIKKEFERKTGGRLIEGYGLSEAPTATHCNPVAGMNKKGSIGLPLPDVDCKIVSIDKMDQEVAPGQIGELWISGPQVMIGYYSDAEETKIALQDGWLRTGDAAYMDKDGYFFLVGRLKELIKVNGLQVWPSEVEQVLNTIVGVREVAVAGIPDEEQGEKVKAWFVMEPNYSLTLEEVRRSCKQRITAYKIPTEIQICDNLPKSPVGKILRRKLVEGG